MVPRKGAPETSSLRHLASGGDTRASHAIIELFARVSNRSPGQSGQSDLILRHAAGHGAA